MSVYRFLLRYYVFKHIVQALMTRICKRLWSTVTMIDPTSAHMDPNRAAQCRLQGSEEDVPGCELGQNAPGNPGLWAWCQPLGIGKSAQFMMTPAHVLEGKCLKTSPNSMASRDCHLSHFANQQESMDFILYCQFHLSAKNNQLTFCWLVL